MNSTRFRLKILVQDVDIDELGHVNNVVYLRWVQDVASAHWQAVGSDELRDKYSWVVLRHEIDYKAPAFKDDVVIGETWVGEHHGPRFDRFVKLFLEKTGKVVAEAKTTWCMLDAKTGKPSRIGQDVLSIL
jgi:acyl-CoA thioester hydrolase